MIVVVVDDDDDDDDDDDIRGNDKKSYSSFKVVRCEIRKNIYMSWIVYGRIKYNPDNLGKESKNAI